MFILSRLFELTEKVNALSNKLQEDNIAGDPEGFMRTQTNKSMKTTHETDRPDKSKFETQIEQPQYERHRRSWATLKWFENTPKTEEGFYLRFRELPDEDVTFLKCFYNITEDWDLFEMICKFWNVQVVSRC
jgi:hypothetical protein